MWIGGLLWLHAMHVELRAEVEIGNIMFHAAGDGKLAILKDFATYHKKFFFHEKILHIDSYDPTAEHDDDEDTPQSMLVQKGSVDDDTSQESSKANITTESTGTGAGATDDDTSLDDDNVVRSAMGEDRLALLARLGVVSKAKVLAEQNARDEAIHILFSTDCSAFQDWQALVVFHSAHQVGQRGHVTRIASGCDAKAQFELVTLYARLWPVSRTGGWVYSVHFHPDFKAEVLIHSKAYKPFGVLNWLRVYADRKLAKTSVHSRDAGSARPLVGNDTIIALIEPDFLFLRPLTLQVRDNAASLFPESSGAGSTESAMPDYVRRGRPVGQLIRGLGAPWALPENRQKPKKALRERDGVSNYFDVEYICGKGSACASIGFEDAIKWHAVGPPYIVHIDDFRLIVDSWVQMVPKIQSGSGLSNRIAVMHAYNLAAVHLKLPHATVLNHMVAHVDYSDSEGWKWIDALGDNVCQPPTEALHADRKIFYPLSALPTLLHYHQYYEVGEFGFYKHLFDTKFFQCNSPLLVEPPLDVGKVRVVQKAGKVVKITEENARRNSFMLCALSRVVNDAVLDVKVRSCHGGGDSEGNIRDVHDVRAEGVKDTYDVVNRSKTINLVLQ